MSRKILAIMLIFSCVAGYGQSLSAELMMLRRRNAILQARIDSLEAVLVSVGPPDDIWSMLRGLDRPAGTVDSASDIDSIIMSASPSLDIPCRPCVLKAIDNYTGRHRRLTCAALGRFACHYEYFRSVFRMHGVPEDLTVLCIVESAVSRFAVSASGAVGMWQLMPSTARQYGLSVDENKDDRTDLKMSCEAAASLLHDLHESLKSWALVVMAYNCGVGSVRKAMLQSGSSDPWEVLSYLPAETQAYLPSFLAASYLSVYGESREGLVIMP